MMAPRGGLTAGAGYDNRQLAVNFHWLSRVLWRRDRSVADLSTAEPYAVNWIERRTVMVAKSRRPRLVAVLWFVAAGLAFVAAGITFFRNRPPNWGALAGGLFSLVMGIASLARKGQPPPAA